MQTKNRIEKEKSLISTNHFLNNKGLGVPIITQDPPLSQLELKNMINSKSVSIEDKELCKLALLKIDKASKQIKKEWLSAFVDFQFKTIYIHF